MNGVASLHTWSDSVGGLSYKTLCPYHWYGLVSHGGRSPLSAVGSNSISVTSFIVGGGWLASGTGVGLVVKSNKGTNKGVNEHWRKLFT